MQIQFGRAIEVTNDSIDWMKSTWYTSVVTNRDNRLWTSRFDESNSKYLSLWISLHCGTNSVNRQFEDWEYLNNQEYRLNPLSNVMIRVSLKLHPFKLRMVDNLGRSTFDYCFISVHSYFALSVNKMNLYHSHQSLHVQVEWIVDLEGLFQSFCFFMYNTFNCDRWSKSECWVS